MKVVLLSTELNQLEILIDTIEFPNPPIVGDYIDILDFLDDNQKSIYKSFFSSESKIEFAHVKSRSWHSVNGEVVMYLHLEHLDEVSDAKPFFF